MAKVDSGTYLCGQYPAGQLDASVTRYDVAEKLSLIFKMEALEIMHSMEIGCKELIFNQAVLDFALDESAKGRNTALVTGNMEDFTEFVVPPHKLMDKFDVIVNSFDYRALDKLVL